VEIRVHGADELVHRRGYAGEGEYVRIRPEKVRNWGIDKSCRGLCEPSLRKGRCALRTPPFHSCSGAPEVEIRVRQSHLKLAEAKSQFTK
jgi:hypothetical protein